MTRRLVGGYVRAHDRPGTRWYATGAAKKGQDIMNFFTIRALIGLVLLTAGFSPVEAATYAQIKQAYDNCFGFCQLQFGSEARIDKCCSVSLTEIVKCSPTCMALERTAFDICLDECANVLLSGNIDLVAELTEDGRQIAIGGPLECSEGFKVADLTVTITQSGSRGVGVGKWKGACTGGEQDWNTLASIRGEGAATFVPGPAIACAVAQFTIGGQGAEAKQWCQEVTVLPLGAELEP